MDCEDDDAADRFTHTRLAAIGHNIGGQDGEFLRRLAEEIWPKWQRRQDRLDGRDDAIREYAATFLPDLNDHPASKALANDLIRETGLAPPLATQANYAKRIAARRIVELSGGKILSAPTLRDILGGERSR